MEINYTDPAYQVDPARLANNSLYTGINVRAQHEDRWGVFDIAELDHASLGAWLRSRGGDNPWAEEVVFKLLGHHAQMIYEVWHDD